MKMSKLDKIVRLGAGGSAVIYRLCENNINVEGLYDKEDLKSFIHTSIDNENWRDSIKMIEALEEAGDDAVFTIDYATEEVFTMNDPDELIEWLINDKRVEVK